MEEELMDVHFCFGCQTTIFGLDSYVEHRKSQCQAKNSPSKTAINPANLPATSVPTSQSGNVNGLSAENVPDLSKAEQFQTLLNVAQNATPLPKHQTTSAESPNKKVKKLKVSDANSLDQPGKTDHFFLSLELQSKSGQKHDAVDVNSPTDKQDKDLPISSFLSNLEFSSEDDEYNGDTDEWVPPQGHTGGKWRPGQRPHSTSLHPDPSHTGGKWKPGNSPPTKRKRGRPRKFEKYSLNYDESESEEEEDSNAVFACDECPEMFVTIEAYAQHIAAGHDWDGLANPDTSIPVQEVQAGNEDVQDFSFISASGDTNKPEDHPPSTHTCSICDKVYYNKYSIARHILTPLHKRRSENHPERFKIMEMYLQPLMYLSPYQCMICRFYFNTQKDITEHIQGKEHKDKVSELICPIVCSSCDFSTADDDGQMSSHFMSPEHKANTERSHKPCAIKKKLEGELKCPHCATTWKSYYMLKRHVEQRHPNGKPARPIFRGKGRFKPQCPFCSMICHSVTALTIHVRRRHTHQRPFHCNVCNSSFCDKNSLKLHYKSARHKKRASNPSAANAYRYPPKPKIKSHKCLQCDHIAPNYKLLRAHVLKTHNQEKVFCTPCKKEFVSSKGLEIHQRATGHSNKTSEEVSTQPLQCPNCTKTFQDPKWFEFHMLSHSHIFNEADVSDKYQGTDITSVKYAEFFLATQFADRREILTCPEPDCAKRVIKPHMIEHLRIHTNDRIYPCPYCEHGFFSSTVLKKHVHKHLGLTHRVCEECGREFTKISTYKNHLLTHDESRRNQHVCSMCGMAFTFIECLRVHERRHGEKVHKCTHPGCRIKFTFKSELTEHFRIHSGEKPYLCDLCGYKSRTKNHMLRHSRTHTGERKYHCEYCTYKAGNSTHLRRHMRIHIGTKPYKCPYCEYSCNTHENIRKHIMKTKKHQGLKIYPCKYCDFGSNTAKEFRNHLEDFHSADLKLENVDVLSVEAGIYDKAGDFAQPREGDLILPAKERKHGGRRAKQTLVVKLKTKHSKMLDYSDGYLSEGEQLADSSSSVLQYSSGDQQWQGATPHTTVSPEKRESSLLIYTKDAGPTDYATPHTTVSPEKRESSLLIYTKDTGPTDYSLNRTEHQYDNQTGQSYREMSPNQPNSGSSAVPLYPSTPMYKYPSYSHGYEPNHTAEFLARNGDNVFSNSHDSYVRHGEYIVNSERINIQGMESLDQSHRTVTEDEIPTVASSVDIY